MFIKQIDDDLKSNGFEFIHNTWFLRKKEFVILIDLQKSQWSNEYYVNAGIIFDGLSTDLLKVNKAQVQWRVNRIDEKVTKDLFNLFDEVNIIMDLINEQIVKPFCGFETKNEIKNYLLRGHNKYLLTAEAKNILNISDEKIIF